MRQSACLVFNTIMSMITMLPSLINCAPVGLASDSIMVMVPTKAVDFSWLGPELFVCCLAHWGSTGVVSFAPDFR